MLVLSRKKNESVLIGSDIRICVVETKGGTVKIGIEAPDNIRIQRAELEQTAFDFSNNINEFLLTVPGVANVGCSIVSRFDQKLARGIRRIPR